MLTLSDQFLLENLFACSAQRLKFKYPVVIVM